MPFFNNIFKVNIINKLYVLTKKILSPPFCYYCREFLDDYSIFCVACTKNIKPIISTKLAVEKNYSIIVHAISDYKEPLKSLILAKNYSDYSASINIANLIYKHTNIKNLEFDYFVPVPLHWTRYAWRGFNQAEVIAKHLSKLTNKPIAFCITRSKKTEFQASLQSKERVLNVLNAFTINENNSQEFYGKTFVIIDDLMTTGSTLKSVAKNLIKYKPKSIHAVVACRVFK